MRQIEYCGPAVRIPRRAATLRECPEVERDIAGQFDYLREKMRENAVHTHPDEHLEASVLAEFAQSADAADGWSLQRDPRPSAAEEFWAELEARRSAPAS